MLAITGWREANGQDCHPRLEVVQCNGMLIKTLPVLKMYKVYTDSELV